MEVNGDESPGGSPSGGPTLEHDSEIEEMENVKVEKKPRKSAMKSVSIRAGRVLPALHLLRCSLRFLELLLLSARDQNLSR